MADEWFLLNNHFPREPTCTNHHACHFRRGFVGDVSTNEAGWSGAILQLDISHEFRDF
jgi:hypothetical protein